MCLALVLGAPAKVKNIHLSRELIDNRPALGVSWTAPPSDQAIVRYVVQYRRVGHVHEHPWQSVNIAGLPLATATNLTGLRSSTKYWVRVRAWSEAVPGPMSGLVGETTYGSEFGSP